MDATYALALDIQQPNHLAPPGEKNLPNARRPQRQVPVTRPTTNSCMGLQTLTGRLTHCRAVFEFATITIHAPNGPNHFIESGSSFNLVTEHLARDLSLISTVMTIQLRNIKDDFFDMKATIYQLGLLDQHNNIH